MKLKAILLLLSVLAVYGTRLRQKIQTEVDPKTVKSPGGFDNVAPDAKKVITPHIAPPKLDIDLKVRTTGVGQRDFHQGSTPFPKIGRVFEPSTGTFDTVPFVDKKKILTTTTTWAPTESLQTVTVDMGNGMIIPAPNDKNQPKVEHGTEPKQK